MTPTPELKPCPINCGGDGVPVKHPDAEMYGHQYKVACDKCGIELPEWYSYPASAITAWNTRAPGTTLTQANERLVEASKRLLPYLDYTVGPESPGHHPTMASAVSAFRTALSNTGEAVGVKEAALSSKARDEALSELARGDAELISDPLSVTAENIGAVACEHCGSTEGSCDTPDEAVNFPLFYPAPKPAVAEPVAWMCEGCGRLNKDPEGDLHSLRVSGALSCCPERKPVPLYPASALQTLQQERDAAVLNCNTATETQNELSAALLDAEARLDSIETKALVELERRLVAIGGCSDGYCIVKKPTGMHTNGGCRCNSNKHKMTQLSHAYRWFEEAIRITLREK